MLASCTTSLSYVNLFQRTLSFYSQLLTTILAFASDVVRLIRPLAMTKSKQASFCSFGLQRSFLKADAKVQLFLIPCKTFAKKNAIFTWFFNTYLHNIQRFVGAHIVFITRGRVGEREERQLKNQRTQISDRKQILVGYRKGLECFWDILGCQRGVGSPPTALLAWVKNEHGQH